VLEVRVQGGSPAAQKGIARSLEPLKEKPIGAAAIAKSLRRVEGVGNREASFETFRTAPPPPLSGTQVRAPDTGVIVHLGAVRNGPPFLLVGADLTAVTSNVSRNNIDLRLIDQDLGGDGSELRADARFGFLTQGAPEYYKPIFSTGLFVQPHLGILRQPVYLWQDQQRIYEAGETWSPEHRAFLRQDVPGAVVASTPFGVITVAGSFGDAGRRKFFFTPGRRF
jgi:NTE family protein